jgi:hypothetical protein
MPDTVVWPILGPTPALFCACSALTMAALPCGGVLDLIRVFTIVARWAAAVPVLRASWHDYALERCVFPQQGCVPASTIISLHAPRLQIAYYWEGDG